MDVQNSLNIKWHVYIYLPGVCMHVVGSSNPAEGLHHQSPGIDVHYHSAYDLSRHPLEQHPPLFVKSEPQAFTPAFTMKYQSPASPVKLTNNEQAFENTSTSVAASQMRNALNNLADTVSDPEEKKVCFEHFRKSYADV